MQTLVEGTAIDGMAYRPAALYINGEYWGIQNPREKVNEHLVAAKFGIDPDLVDMMEYQTNNQVVPIRGDGAAWASMMEYFTSADIGAEATLVEMGRGLLGADCTFNLEQGLKTLQARIACRGDYSIAKDDNGLVI